MEQIIPLIPRLHKLLRSNYPTVSTHTLEDVVQSALLSYHKNPNYDPSKGSLIRHIYNICVCRLIDNGRRDKSYNRSNMGYFKGREGNPHPVCPNTVDFSVYNLDPIYTEVLDLRINRGWSNKQIMGTLNVCENTVKTRFFRAIEKIRPLIGTLNESGPNQSVRAACPIIG